MEDQINRKYRRVVYNNWGNKKIIPTVNKQLKRKDKQIRVKFD